MIHLLITSFVVPILIGFFLCVTLFPTPLAMSRHFPLLNVFLGVGVGIGISSSIFFLSLLFFDLANNFFMVIEMAFLFCLILVFLFKFKLENILNLFKLIRIIKFKFHRLLSASFYTALIFSLIAFILISLNHPHGQWDAWAIWNMRARFIFRGGDQWAAAFSSLLGWSHPDYPLLIPAMVARGWKFIGRETQLVPSLVSMLFTFATIGLTASALFNFRGKNQGFLGGIILLGTPFLIKQGTWQYADIPLSFFLLATIVLFILHDSYSKDKPNLLILAGMTTGFSAWTKNEGLLFLFAIIIARFVLLNRLKCWRINLREIILFGLGIGPILAMIIYFKIKFAPPNDLLSFQSWHFIIGRLTDWPRYFQIIKAFAAEIICFGNWVFNIPALLVLVLYGMLLGIKIEEKQRLSIAHSLIIIGLILIGYFFIYLISPHNLQWQLGTSLNRLLLHLWPSFIFIFFLMVCVPDPEFGGKKFRREE